MASAEFFVGTYRTGFIPKAPHHPKIDLRTPQERERDMWVGERSERRIASVLRGIRIGGKKVTRNIVRYGKTDWEDYKKKDMTVLFIEGSPIESVDIQSKSSPTGEEAFLEEMKEDMERKGIKGISSVDWMAINRIILLNGSRYRIQIEEDFKFQLYRVLKMQKVVV